MSGNLLGLIELALVFLVVLGWAFYELHTLKAKPQADPGAEVRRAGDIGRSAPGSAGQSPTPPRHPERQ